ncbi:MAG: regulatory iron-sulfur-containing complex subunit RicT [Bacteroidota bacterium]
MGCSSCSTDTGQTSPGCNNNGTCGTSGCNKLNVYNWLSDMVLPEGQKPFDVVEVRFKGSRKEFFRNSEQLELKTGDVVAVEGNPGHDIGIVSLAGELVRLQLKANDLTENSDKIKALYRLAKPADLEKWEAVKAQEFETMHKARSVAMKLHLKMKLSDVEFQGDGKKATFYYTADDRVDFRELIKRLADEFKVRIEMRQIGMRQEASRLGGIGSCGRELCCSTWLTDFKIVSTSAARYQNLSLNPIKLAGQCGKLKCCLNYELDSYMEAIKDIPDSNTRLQTLKGTASHRKTDILRRIMWFGYDDVEGPAGADNWVVLQVDHVKEILEMNKAGNKPLDLASFADFEEEEKAVDYADVVGQDSLTRMMDKRKKKKKKKKQGGGGDRREGVEAKAPQPTQKALPQEGNRPPREQRPQNQPKNTGNQPRREGGGQQQTKGPKPPQQNQQGQRPPRSTPNNNNQTSSSGGDAQQRRPQPPSNPPSSSNPPTSNNSSGQSSTTGGRVRQIPPRTKPDSES